MTTTNKTTEGTMDASMARSIDYLGLRLADIGARAAIAWLRQHGHEAAAKADVAGLSAALRSVLPAASLRALDEARAAFSIGMADVGSATAAATMALAGIEAAKRFATEAR